MTAPSTVCPSCGEDVPFGRRTCENCGANVAAVAAPHASDTEPDEAAEPDADDATLMSTGGPAPEVEGTATPESREDEPAPLAPAAPAPPEWPQDQAQGFVPPVLREWNPGTNIPETGFATELAAAEAEPAGLAGAWLPPAAGAREAALPPTFEPIRPDAAPPPEPPPGDSPGPMSMPASLADMMNRGTTAPSRWPSADLPTPEPTAAGVPPVPSPAFDGPD